MKLKVKRRWPNEVCTLGELYVDGEMECFTCEDAIREVKIAGKTAIPTGTYRVIVDFSKRFQKLMPHILDVPHFDGIRIHCGNTAENTEGCILVGAQKLHNAVGQSRVAFGMLSAAIQAALARGEEVTITVS